MKTTVCNIALWLVLFLGFSANALAQPVAGFTASVVKKCGTAEVQFTDLSTGNPDSWSWDFGNGLSSVSQNPFVIYTAPGIYSVSLIAGNSAGRDTILKTGYIIVDSLPEAKFIITPPMGCLPFRTSFINQSNPAGGTIAKWFWDFGDGATADSANPEHTYTVGGTYTVQLIVENTQGCRDTLHLDSAVRTGTKPIPSFTANPLSACASDPFNFFNTTTGTVTSWFWDFGDTDTSTRKSPSHYYQDSGKMTIKLIATNNGCSDSVIRYDYVFVKPPFVRMHWGYSCDTPYVRNFQAKYLGVKSFWWDFGDGTTSLESFPSHTYLNTGTYKVKLHAFGTECSFTDTAMITIIDEKPVLTYSTKRPEICRYDTVLYTATGYNPTNVFSFAWNFGDGTIKPFDRFNNTNHIYTKTGSYYPSLITKDILGCNDTAANIVKVDIYGPQAAFINSSLICAGTNASITDQSLGDGTHTLGKWIWDYGDGITDTLYAPPFNHIYNNPGTFPLKLKVADSNGCLDTLLKVNAIVVSEKPVAAFTVTDTLNCLGSQVSFLDQSVGTVQLTNRSWNFGDGGVSTQINPVHNYQSVGTYTATLVTQNGNGCVDTASKEIKVLPAPNVNAGLDSVICQGQSIMLMASGAITYSWMADTSLSCNTCPNPNATPQTTTRYYLTGTDTAGCSALDSVLVQVKQPFAISFLKNSDTVCIGSSIQLLATGAEIYNWQPSTGLNNINIPNPVAKPASTITYQVIGTDNKNCFSDTASFKVTVAPYPSFNIIDSSVTLAGGSSYIIKTNSSADVVRWQWLPPTDLSCTTCAEPTARTNKIIQYTATAYNAYGCSVSDKITVKGLCNGELIFIPNTFSPNGDHVNDYFYPRGAGLYLIKSMRIFNRLGQAVFEKVNFSPDVETEGWNGTFRSKKLPQDVYIYFIELICNDGKIFTVKGDITLL